MRLRVRSLSAPQIGAIIASKSLAAKSRVPAIAGGMPRIAVRKKSRISE
jgi:hypothetical protein